MFGWKRPLSLGASVLCCALLATPVFAQGVKPAVAVKGGPRPGVRQMEIYNGATRTVKYFGDNLSPSESSVVREMERLENESGYVGDLQALKRQYVASERLLELNRRVVQLSLYGREITRSASSADSFSSPGYGRGLGGYASYGYLASGYYGYPYAFGGLSSYSSNVSERYSLADGVGPQGPVADAMAQVLAQQATPEYAANVERNLDRVAMQASASPRLRAALRLPSVEEMRKERGVMLAGSDEAPVTLTLKSGEKVHGTALEDQKEWYVVDKVGGGKAKVKASEVMRIDMAPGVRPAG